jgi:glycosyltransferase involved in cell wall biosynthesis
VNLAKQISNSAEFEIAVAGNSTSDYFYRELEKTGVCVRRTAEVQDAFAHTEALISKICSEGFGTVCFWNVDRRVKLLLVKALAATSIKFIDVSPGGYAFEEIDEVRYFQRMIVFTKAQYYRRLDKLVLKYDGPYPQECEGKVVVIRNGVPESPHVKRRYEATGTRVAVSGRIAPTKFLKEIIFAMSTVRKEIPEAQLHIYGVAEENHSEYLERVMQMAKIMLGKNAVFHGSDFEAIKVLPDHDAFVVLGRHQGCPNALLEALSVGLPVVANDDGGTREQVQDGVTGLLIPRADSHDLARALLKILTNKRLAAHLGTTGRVFVHQRFGMDEMAKRYLKLLKDLQGASEERRERVFA